MLIFVVPGWYATPSCPQNGVFFTEQAEMLKNSGDTVVIINVTERGRKDYFAKDNYKLLLTDNSDIPVIQYCVPNFPLNLFPALRTKSTLKRLQKAYSSAVGKYGVPDAIIAHSVNAAFIVCGLQTDSGIVKLYVEHSSRVLNQKIPERTAGYLKYVVETADSSYAVSNALKKSIEDITGMNGKVNVLHNPLYRKFTCPDNFHNNDRFTFISVGSLRPNKGFARLIDAFTNAFSESDNVCLNIIGDGSEKASLAEKIEKTGRSRQIKMLGHLSRDDVYKEMCSSDAFVLASEYETFGIVYIEALACGLPVITQKNGGSEDVVNSDNGILLENGSCDGYEDAMKSMVANVGRYDRKSISKNCLDAYSEHRYCSVIHDSISKIKTGKKNEKK